MYKRLLTLIFATALIAAACGSDGDDTTAETGADETTTSAAAEDETTTSAADADADADDESATTESSAATDTEEDADAEGDAAADGADLMLSTTDLGDVLVDSGGNTIYLFTPDEQGDSTCYDDCEANWPVVGELTTVGEGLDASLLGTTTRENGDAQATYNDWPLYYFANDATAGDTAGQGVGDVWYVLDAEGNAIGLG